MKPSNYKSRAQAYSDWQKRSADQQQQYAAQETTDQYLTRSTNDGHYGNVNLNNYLDTVYRNVPGGKDETIRIANEYGANVDPKKLNRNVFVSGTEYLDNNTGGVYYRDQDKIQLNDNLGKSNENRRDVLKHELQHAIMRDAPVDRIFPKGVAGQEVNGPQPGFSKGVNKSFNENPVLGIAHSLATVPAEIANYATRDLGSLFGLAKKYEHSPSYVQNPKIDNYYSQSDEADAEFFSKVKHWGAEQGILPKNEAEARALLDLYMKRTGLNNLPVGSDDSLKKDRAPAIRRKLFKSKYAPVYLLRSVKGSNNPEDSNV
jgi:hypothetical protein